MRRFVLLLLLLPHTLHAEMYIAIVQGLGGEEKFSQRFQQQIEKISELSGDMAKTDNVRVFTEDAASRDEILAWFDEVNNKISRDDRLGLFLIGHGSYDGHQYKFNIKGPDLTGEDILHVMDGSPAEFQILVNTSSSSGALLKPLGSETRIVMTATKSGAERNATRFGAYLVAGLETSAADSNKNDAISAKEAFDYAERMTLDFYESEGRLATEHPQIRGDRAAQFTLSRLTPDINAGGDAVLASLLEQKRELDRDIEDLQFSKQLYGHEEYLDSLQTLLIDLALLQDRIDVLQDSP